MKGDSMRVPALTQVYTQKIMYQAHMRKLMNIRQQRKKNLAINSDRMDSIENIKDSRSRSFAHRFNQKSNRINDENLKLLHKLKKVKSSVRYEQDFQNQTSRDKSCIKEGNQKQFSLCNPYTKRKMLNVQKQNERIITKMNTMSSSLNQKKFMIDFAKSQQIKSRIMRYSNNKDIIKLKSQQVLDHLESNSLKDYEKTQRKSEIHQRRTTASYYKKEDILRNKVARAKQGIIKDKLRPFTSNQGGKQISFFTTQPQKKYSGRKMAYH